MPGLFPHHPLFTHLCTRLNTFSFVCSRLLVVCGAHMRVAAAFPRLHLRFCVFLSSHKRLIELTSVFTCRPPLCKGVAASVRSIITVFACLFFPLCARMGEGQFLKAVVGAPLIRNGARNTRTLARMFRCRHVAALS